MLWTSESHLDIPEEIVNGFGSKFFLLNAHAIESPIGLELFEEREVFLVSAAILPADFETSSFDSDGVSFTVPSCYLLIRSVASCVKEEFDGHALDNALGFREFFGFNLTVHLMVDVVELVAAVGRRQEFAIKTERD